MELLAFWVNILLPILSIAIPVFATIYTVNNRIRNENKENHKPYLVLTKIVDKQQLDVYSYYLIMIGKNYLAAHEEEIKTSNDALNIELIISNIGYGVATNIKFYNLLTGNEVKGEQESNKDQNQKLFTTFDIASGASKEIQAKVLSLVMENNDDHNRILCVYKDLNNNVYSFIISINVKTNNHYDFFAYQPSSASYKRWIKQNDKEYKKIMKKYGKL